MLYMIQSKTSGEIYVSNGHKACGPLDHSVIQHPLSDYNLDNEAPDWVAERQGRILREEGVNHETYA